jgi:hypothetical protein
LDRNKIRRKKMWVIVERSSFRHPQAVRVMVLMRRLSPSGPPLFNSLRRSGISRPMRKVTIPAIIRNDLKPGFMAHSI